MIKTQIQLEPWQYDEVKRLGKALSRSMSDIIRESLTMGLGRMEQRPLKALEEIAGKYRSLPTTGLKDHDRHLAESVR